MYDCFISYSRKDEKIAISIYETLRSNGISCWLDQYHLVPGENYAGNITRAIKNSNLIVFVWSHNSVRSKDVEKEIKLADKHGIAVLPFRLDDSNWSDDLDYILIGKQWIDATAGLLEEHIEKIVNLVRKNSGAENSFDTDFESDDEVDEMLDNFIVSLGRKLREANSHTAIVNPYRIQHILYTYKLLKYLTKGTTAQVSYKLYEPYKWMGSVSVVGRDLYFREPEWFMKAVELANNFDVYPRTDGSVVMSFSFSGLTRAID